MAKSVIEKRIENFQKTKGFKQAEPTLKRAMSLLKNESKSDIVKEMELQWFIEKDDSKVTQDRKLGAKLDFEESSDDVKALKILQYQRDSITSALKVLEKYYSLKAAAEIEKLTLEAAKKYGVSVSKIKTKKKKKAAPKEK